MPMPAPTPAKPSESAAQPNQGEVKVEELGEGGVGYMPPEPYQSDFKPSYSDAPSQQTHVVDNTETKSVAPAKPAPVIEAKPPSILKDVKSEYVLFITLEPFLFTHEYSEFNW